MRKSLTDSIRTIYQVFVEVSPDIANSMDEVRGIVARYKSSIVSETLQTMRLTEELLIVPLR